jgi:hypothetical protein
VPDAKANPQGRGKSFMDTTTKHVIVNGSYNKNITLEEILTYPHEDKIRFFRSLIFTIEYGSHIPDINHSLFVKTTLPYSNETITLENIDELLNRAFDDYSKAKYLYQYRTYQLNVGKGQSIYKAQNELGFSGFIRMDYSRLIGYVKEQGQWNGFNPRLIIPVIENLEQLCPRIDYGFNNPNTGAKKHIWTTSGEYITLYYDFVDQKMLDRINQFYKNVFEIKAKSAKADSARIEITDLSQNEVCKGYYNAELIMWWD